MEIDYMENLVESVKSEIRNWVENKGYDCHFIHVVNNVSFRCYPKISHEDINEFKNEFGREIVIKGVKFNEDGTVGEYEYDCDHDRLFEFRNLVRDWLQIHGIQVISVFLTSNIEIYTYGELLDNQIKGFEDEFDVKCRGYDLSCSSREIRYIFC